MTFCKNIDERCKDQLYLETEKVIKKIAAFQKELHTEEEKFLKLYASLKKESLVQSFLRYMQDIPQTKKERPNKKLTLLVENLREQYITYLKTFEAYKINLLKLPLKNIDKKTLLDEFSILNSRNEALRILINTETLQDKKSYFATTKRIMTIFYAQVELLYIVLNLVSEGLFYVKDISLKKLKKISQKSLQEGDILLLRKTDEHLKKFRKVASRIMDSNFIHSAIIYKIERGDIYLFQGLAGDEQQTLISPIEHIQGYTYVVMRPKKRLSKEQKQRLQKLEENNVGIKYSYAKVFAGFFERHLERFLENSTILTRDINPLGFIPGVFCSEIVARIYGEVGVHFGFSHDPSMVGPLDILNAPELEMVGYFV